MDRPFLCYLTNKHQHNAKKIGNILFYGKILRPSPSEEVNHDEL